MPPSGSISMTLCLERGSSERYAVTLRASYPRPCPSKLFPASHGYGLSIQLSPNAKAKQIVNHLGRRSVSSDRIFILFPRWRRNRLRLGLAVKLLTFRFPIFYEADTRSIKAPIICSDILIYTNWLADAVLALKMNDF